MLVLEHSVQIFNNVFLGAGLCDARRVSQLWSEILFSMSSDSSNQLRMKQTDVGYCQLKNLLLKHIELMFFKIRKTDQSILSYKRLFSLESNEHQNWFLLSFQKIMIYSNSFKENCRLSIHLFNSKVFISLNIMFSKLGKLKLITTLFEEQDLL